MGLLKFDARTVAPQVGLDPVPEGWYKTVVTKSNTKAVSTGNGGMLELILTIIEGQYQNRILYWNLNLYNTNQQAVEIAYKQLSALCHVIGQFNVEDNGAPDMVVPLLHNIPFMTHAVVSQGTNGPINNIKAVRDINGNDPGKLGATTQAAPANNQQPPNNQPPQGGYQAAPAPQNNPPQGQTWQPQGQTQPPQNNPPPNQGPGGWQAPAGGAPQGGGAWQSQPATNQPQGAPQPAQGGWQGPGGPAPQQGAWQPQQGGGGAAQAAPWNR